MIQSVSFIGMGAMGSRMAAHLVKHFDQVYVWNRDQNKAQQHQQRFGSQAATLEQAAQSDIIFSCLPSSKQVDQILEQVQPKSGSIWVDCTSGEPNAARLQAQRLAELGVAFLDAPVSGQTIGAENASLTFMVGGDRSAFDRAEPVMRTMGKLVQHVGESGAGFAVKAVNNMMMAIHLCAAAEGLSTLKAHGVELSAALACINASSGKSVVTDTIIPQKVLNRSFPKTFGLDLLAKDTGIAVDLVRDARISAPVTNLSHSLIQAASNIGTADMDFSTAIQLYETWNKLKIE